MAKKAAAKRSATKPAVRDRVHIFVDEVGDLSKTVKKGSSKIFGYGTSVVKNLDKYAQVSKDHKKKGNVKGEVKVRNMSQWQKISYSFRIRLSGAKTSGVYVDKRKDTPKGWIEQSGRDAQIGMLRKTLDLTLSKIKAKDVTIIVDDHQTYHEADGTNLVENMENGLKKRHGKNISIRTGGSKSDPYRDHMQTNDATPHSIMQCKEEQSPWMSIVMGQKLKRLDKNDDIENK